MNLLFTDTLFLSDTGLGDGHLDFGVGADIEERDDGTDELCVNFAFTPEVEGLGKVHIYLDRAEQIELLHAYLAIILNNYSKHIMKAE
jgi:hypothetical protein